MQTFLPYADFYKSAKTLDRQRLGKQRVEAYQILKTLKEGSRWENHPAVLMWKGHEGSLAAYALVICATWVAKGYEDNCKDKILKICTKDNLNYNDYPDWLGNEQFHLSHQSNLVRKKPEHYGLLFPDVPDDLPYFWPTKA